jgi:hypothetical protein
MREFRGSVAVSLPRKHMNIVLFQYVRAWQCLAVAGVCHARKLLINKMKSGVVADAWQLYINIYPRGISPRRYIDDSHRIFWPKFGGRKQTTPSIRSQPGNGSGGDHSSCVDRGRRSG